jgi:tetratricopeptide (TPR) repeat protein
VLLTQVARALGLAGRFDDAETILSSVTSDEPEVEVRVVLERGRVVNSSGGEGAARPLFETAHSLAARAGFEHLAIDALHMVAIVAPPEEQDELNRRALALANSGADPRARQWGASLLNNLGWTAFDRGDYAGALALFQDALAARLEHGKEAEILVARWCVGRTLRALGRAEQALALQQELAAELRAAGRSDPYVDEEIAALTQTSTTPEPGTG